MTSPASRSKITELRTAIETHIRPGDHVHLGYNEARPNAAVLELVRTFRGQNPELTISSAGLVSAQAALFTETITNHVIASFIGDNYPTGGPNPVLQSAIDSGAISVEETSLWTIVARLMAGALGVNFLPVNSLMGSDLARQDWVDTVVDPFGDGESTVVSALRPDVVLIHAVAGDEEGNLILSPPYGETAWGALASRRGVIATVETVLSAERLRQYNALVSIPAHKVIAVCNAPMGAHPYGLYSPIPEVPGYVEDEDFIKEQRAASRNSALYDEWVADWVIQTVDHHAYVQRLGQARVAELIGKASPGAWSYVADRIDESSPATATETMVVEASRCVIERIRAGQFTVLMTGIGYANLAAWLAHASLAESSEAPYLMAEIGAYGYTPRQGDPFIFSHRNLPTCGWMTDVTSILGSVVSGDHGDCLAIVGAGNIDQYGNVNSSRTEHGGFLVGSGGANDIANGASELIVVIKHGRTRLVDQVPFITSPGSRVRTIVTDRGVMVRKSDNDQFVLTKVIVGEGSVEDAVRSAVEGCGWPLQVATDVHAVDLPSQHLTHRLRSYDPRAVFLKVPRPPKVENAIPWHLTLDYGA